MEVGKIKQNLPMKSVMGLKSPAKTQDVTFGNASFATRNATKKALIMNQMPSAIKRLISLKWVNGEAGGIIINALGTGLVAPIFIAFNPLSDKDEETKKYTALRQPVSAVLAILIQLGLTKPLDILYDNLSNKGKLGDHLGFNQSRLNSSSFMKRIKADKYPSDKLDLVVENARNEQVSNVAKELQKFGFIKNLNGTAFDNKEIISAALEALNARIEDAEENIISITNDKIAAKSKRAYLLLSKDANGENVLRKLCKELQTLTSMDEVKKKVERWIEENAVNNPDLEEIANEFVRRDRLLDITERAKKTMSKISDFENALANTQILRNNNEFLVSALNEYRNASQSRRSELLSEFTKIATQNGDKAKFGGLSQIVEILKGLEEAPNEKLLQSYLSKFMSRISEYRGAGDNLEEIIRIYQTGYYTDEKDAAIYTKELLEQLKESGKTATENVKEFFASINKKLKINLFEKEAVEKLRGKIERRVKGYTQITNILVGLLITLPITCTALNWVYPRFMNIFFPELANSKKSDAPEEKVKKGGIK